jgi:hypothetical protein
VDRHGEGAWWIEFHDLHLALHRCVPPGVDPLDPRTEPERPLRQLLEVHVGIPPRMIADVLCRVEAPDITDRAVDLDRDPNVHDSLLYASRRSQ